MSKRQCNQYSRFYTDRSVTPTLNQKSRAIYNSSYAHSRWQRPAARASSTSEEANHSSTHIQHVRGSQARLPFTSACIPHQWARVQIETDAYIIPCIAVLLAFDSALSRRHPRTSEPSNIIFKYTLK